MARKMVEDDELVKLLLLNGSVDRVATNCNLSKSAVYKRLENCDFRQKLEIASKGALSAAASELTLSVSTAISTLVEICKDGQINGQTRALAANSIIQHAAKFTELTRAQRKADEDEGHELELGGKLQQLIHGLMVDDEDE